MDLSRRRVIRSLVSPSVFALSYTSFSASTEAKEPSQILTASPGTSYEMTGKVVRGSVEHKGKEGIAFKVVDREGSGQAIVLTGSLQSGTFVGEPETLITKCPSKFAVAKSNG